MSNGKKASKNEETKKGEARRVATMKQIEFLLDFLRDNDELRYTRIRSKESIFLIRQLWDACTEEINKMGPSRNAKEWAKYWSDMKSRVKQRVAEMNKRSLEAGEGSSAGTTLTHVEQRIVNMLERDQQFIKATQEGPLDVSAGSSLDSINFAILKEEKGEILTQEHDAMNVEEFISTAPVVINNESRATSKPPPINMAQETVRPATVSLPCRPPTVLPQLVPANVFQPVLLLSPTAKQGPSLNRPQSVPLRESLSPKRRPRPRVIQTRPGRSRKNIPCMSCADLKQFAETMLKLEDTHAKTIKLQIEQSMNTTEVMKLQAEGMMHTGIALREMANNISRVLDGHNLSNRQNMTM